MKKIAILQSNYIPWKGYFDMIAAVDEFILYDDVQFTKNDWRNRNKIKTPSGVQWLSIPVRQERLDQKISETKVSDRRWADKHWKTIKQNYSRAEGFSTYSSIIAETYQQASELEFLSDINLLFIRTICKLANIQTTISLCTDYNLIGDRMSRLVSLCEQASASVYVSGPAAKSYLDEDAFLKFGITVEWMDYSGYKEYPQLYPPFEHGVSMIDLLFNLGLQYSSYMKFVKT
ncbi:MAG: WbqC family protein [Methylococcales bacterium]|nr:WbqC family protein [Methylococcales bacterium]